MKAFGYLRVSTDKQEVEAQRSQVRAYADYRAIELLAIPDEIDVSGATPFAKRPVGSEILRRLDECDAIIFPKVDRGFRDLVDAVLTVADLRKAGKHVIFLDFPIDTTTPVGSLCFAVVAAMAEFERRRTGERIKEKIAESKKRPDWHHGPAGFGFRNAARVVDGRKVNGGRHEPVAEEARIIGMIRGWRGDGYTLRKIAGALSDANIPTRRGGKWGPSNVAKILGRMA